MIKLTELLAEFQQENTVLLIEIDEQKFKKQIGIIEEGRWVQTGEKDYWMRVDTPRVPCEKKHITIAHQKHIHNRDKQVTWNYDGTRKDKKTFDDSFIGIERAKEIARRKLNIPPEIKLEAYNVTEDIHLLLEDTSDTTILTYAYIKIK